MPKTDYGYNLPAHKVTIRMVPLDQLYIAGEAQRSQLNKARTAKMAENFSIEAAGTIIACEDTNGDLFVVDGWHRTAAATDAGYSEIRTEVHHDLERKHWSQLFLIKNKETGKVSPLDGYRNGVTSEMALYTDTEKVLVKHKLEMGSSSVNKIGAVNGVLKIVTDYGPEVLDRTLSLAEKAWGRTAKTWDGMILGGLGKLIGEHGDRVDDELMARKLGRETPDKWVARINSLASLDNLQATGTHGRVSAAYGLFVRTWDNNLRNPAKRIAA